MSFGSVFQSIHYWSNVREKSVSCMTCGMMTGMHLYGCMQMIDSSIHLKLECDCKAYVVCLMSLVKRAASLFFGFFFLFTTSPLMSLVDVYIMLFFLSF